MASVGVCTRPTDATLPAREPNIRFVIARVPLIPMSQSLSLRERAASARPVISAPSRRRLESLRESPAASSICIQARFTGMLALRELVEIVENQLALAAGVAGVDDFVDVLASDQFLERREAFLRIVRSALAQIFPE